MAEGRLKKEQERNERILTTKIRDDDGNSSIGWTKFHKRTTFGINLGFWETANLPLPQAIILPKVRSKC